MSCFPFEGIVESKYLRTNVHKFPEFIVHIAFPS